MEAYLQVEKHLIIKKHRKTIKLKENHKQFFLETKNKIEAKINNIIKSKLQQINMVSVIHFETDTYGSWGIGQESLPKDTPINIVMNRAFMLKAHVVVKPKNGKWYIKGFNGRKTYQDIKSHLEENENTRYHDKTKSILINYTDFQEHFTWLSS